MKNINSKNIIFILALCVSSLFFLSCPVNKGIFRIEDVLALAKVYDSGENIAQVIVKYSSPVDPTSISFGDFVVPNRKILSLSVNRTPVATGKSVPGQFVIIELDTPKKVSPKKDLFVSVLQQGAVWSTDRAICKPQKDYKAASKIIEDIVPDFWIQNYTEEDTRAHCWYYLYIPRNYSAALDYPLVALVPDGKSKDEDPVSVLKRNRMAVALAEPKFQKKHPCIIAVFTYENFKSGDQREIARKVRIIRQLLSHMISEYAVDEDRIYAISEKAGNELLSALTSALPDFFAGTIASIPNSAKENPWNNPASMDYLFAKEND